MTAPAASAVEAAIAAVDDPCSIATNAPLSVFELGLIRDWTIDADGDVRVTLSPTSPHCLMVANIVSGIERRVGAVPGVRDVTVVVDIETFWTPNLMTDAGRRKLEERRQGSLGQVPVRPRQWQEELPASKRLPLAGSAPRR